MYAGKTLKEIAGYDDAFMQWVLCRPRDEYGKLIRVNPDLPWWVNQNLDADGHWKLKDKFKRPLSVAFDQVMKSRGLDEKQRRAAWAEWMKENPKYGKCGGT
jgi:hypothetical protein